MSSAAFPPEWSVIFRVTIEDTEQHEGIVDARKLVEFFPDEWEEFMRGDEPSEDDLYEFIQQTANELGSDFFLVGASPYASGVKVDNDLIVSIQEVGRAKA